MKNRWLAAFTGVVAIFPLGRVLVNRTVECGLLKSALPQQQQMRTAQRLIVRFTAKGGVMKIQRRQFLHMAAGAAALPVVSCAASLGQGTPTNTTMVVERTQYFAKPGLAAEVLAVRRKASAVRVSIGLPAGDIFVKHPGGDRSEPDAAWQCPFAAPPPREAVLPPRPPTAAVQAVSVHRPQLHPPFVQ